MRLKMTDLQRFAKKAIDEENSSLELRNEIRRILGPRSLVEGSINDIVKFANERIDILEYNGRKADELGFKPSLLARYVRHSDAQVRKLAARVLPEGMIATFELDTNVDVRRTVAKRLPASVVRRMSKRSPTDSVIRECLHRKVLTEAGMKTPEKAEHHTMYHDERLGDAVKQNKGPELSDVWYETMARRFMQDYGRDLEQNWEEAVVHRFCSSTRATSGVEVDEERLLKAVTDLMEEHDDEVIDGPSLKETVEWLRSGNDYIDLSEKVSDPVAELVESRVSASEYVAQASKIFKIMESTVPVALMKYRISESSLRSRRVPCVGSIPGGVLREVDERALSTFVSNWNSKQAFAGEPIHISWHPHPTELGKVGFKVELR